MYSFPATTPCNRFSGNESAHARRRARGGSPDTRHVVPVHPVVVVLLRPHMAAPGTRSRAVEDPQKASVTGVTAWAG